MKKILIILVPLIIACFISQIIYFKEVDYGELYSVNGKITEFDEGRFGARTINRPMSVVINGQKYVIDSGVRWASSTSELEDVLQVGNQVRLQYYKNNKRLSVVSIKENGEYVVSLEESINGKTNQKNTIALFIFYAGYTYSLGMLLFYIFSSSKYNFAFDLKYFLTIYSSKPYIILIAISSTILYIGLIILSAVINKWLYLPLFLVLCLLLSIELSTVNSIKAGKGNTIFIYRFKRHKFNWNQLKEYLLIPSKNKYTIILNFKEKYNENLDNPREYLKFCKKEKNDLVFKFKVTENELRLLNITNKKKLK